MQPAVILTQKDVARLRKLAGAFAKIIDRLEGAPAPTKKESRSRRSAVAPSPPALPESA